MTYELEIQIEELRAEVRNAVDGAERGQIQAELEVAQAELAVAAAGMDGFAEADPSFRGERCRPRSSWSICCMWFL